MELWQFGCVLAVLAVKVAFFVYFHYKHIKKNAKSKEIEYNVLQPGKLKEGAKKVVVTGGCGYLGRHIVSQLCEKYGDRVNVFVLDAASKPSNLHPDVTYITGDLCTYTHLSMAFTRADCVIHTAALIPALKTKLSDLQRVIEQGTRNVVEACLEKDVRGLVYTSSAIVTLPKGGGVTKPTKETDPFPDEVLPGYAACKVAAEKLVRAVNSHVLKTVVLRPGGIYGLNDQILQDLILKGDPYVPGPRDNLIPFVWVEDCARAHVMAMDQLVFPDPAKPKIHGRAYHLCHDPVTDPTYYGEFLGGPAPGKPKDKISTTSWGLRHRAELPVWVGNLLTHINEGIYKQTGIVAIHNHLTYDNLFLGRENWPCDTSDAKDILGWQPAAPWKVLAGRLSKKHFESKKRK